MCSDPGGDHSGPSSDHVEPQSAVADVLALHPQLGCPAEQGPWSQSQSVSFYSLTGSSWRASPHPLPAPALPLSFPLWTESSRNVCLPVRDQVDMGTVRAQQLCWSILGFLLLQGKRHVPLSFSSSSPGLAVLGDCPSFGTQTTHALHPGLCPREIPEAFCEGDHLDWEMVITRQG